MNNVCEICGVEVSEEDFGICEPCLVEYETYENEMMAEYLRQLEYEEWLREEYE